MVKDSNGDDVLKPMSYHVTPVKTAIIKNSTKNKYWMHRLEKKWNLHIIVNIWCSHYGTTVESVPQKLKKQLPYDPTILLLRIHLKKQNN